MMIKPKPKSKELLTVVYYISTQKDISYLAVFPIVYASKEPDIPLNKILIKLV